MRISTIVMLALAMTASPAVAVDFLGVELCKGSTDTTVNDPGEMSGLPRFYRVFVTP